MLAWSAIVLLRLVLRCMREEIHNGKARRRQADSSWGDTDVVSDKAVSHLGVSKLPTTARLLVASARAATRGVGTDLGRW